VEVRTTAHLVEVWFRGKRITSHQRSFDTYGCTTIPEHLPSTHQAYAAQQDLEYYLERGRAIGPNMEAFLGEVMAKRKHQELGFRSCLGILNLTKGYGSERMESVAQRAIQRGIYSYKSVKSMLEKGLDQRPYIVPVKHTPIVHENIRGAGYFNTQGDLL
jgi:hypothetical protein